MSAPPSRPHSRRSFLTRVAALLTAILAPAGAAASTVGPPLPRRLVVRGARQRYAGDRALFVTLSPGVPERDAARVAFTIDRPARVTIEAVRTGINGASQSHWRASKRYAPGDHVVTWTPELDRPVGSYVMRVTSADGGRRRVLGARRPPSLADARAPVVRLLGIEAAFLRRAYTPGEPMALRIFADAPSLTLTFLRCGPELEGTDRVDEMRGVPFGEPVSLDWTGKRSAPVTVEVQTGEWASGLYAARLEAPDGRLGFAPFVLHAVPGAERRVAVVLPTHTWQAYNLYDADGDGWGDTWYAGGVPPVDLTRPYRDRGVPPRFRRYDLPFLHAFHWNGLDADFLVDDDLDAAPAGDDLRARYDLLVFPGHSEYQTLRAYDNVTRFRDLGGRLIFLSANNFFWRVERRGETIHRRVRWRDAGRPEASLLGVQYRANDDGRARRPFVLVGVDAVPWLFAGTGLANGDLLGDVVGGYGIEIDATTPRSPSETVVIARIPGLYGPGFDAEMTYYETDAGARVFSAGTLDFTSSTRTWPVRRMLINLWEHMLKDLPPAPGPDPPTPPPTQSP